MLAKPSTETTSSRDIRCQVRPKCRARRWLRNDNPCDRVLVVLGPQNDIVTHRQALSHKDVAAAIETVRGSRSAQSVVRLAFEFLVLTAARMKAKRERRVRLCGRPLEDLDTARAYFG